MTMESGQALRFAVMGSGGVGGYFGARLAAAGYDVSFVARGPHLEALRARGLAVRSPLGDLQLATAQATDDTAGVGVVDVVLVAVKLYDVEAAARQCLPLVGPRTLVVSFLNGIDSEDVLASTIGRGHVAGGVARISANIAEPGVIDHHGRFASLEFGELEGGGSERMQRLLAACTGAGIKARVCDDIVAAIWHKFIFLASFAAVTALTRLPFGPIRRHPPTFALLERAVAEAAAVGLARGVVLGADPAGDAMRVVHGLDDGIKASMLVDLERGKPLELDYLSGAVVRLGRELGVATPVHEIAAAALAPYVSGTPEGA
jgi:2-dehydropantoate 2-reductase